MKNIIIITSILISTQYYSQVAIGKTGLTNASVSLEFENPIDEGNGNIYRGLLLPWVNSSTAVTMAVNGTLIFDSSDNKIKYRNDGTWVDLSINSGASDTSLQAGLKESSTAKVIIGSDSETNNTPGILVLSDENKAMILPKVPRPEDNIIEPSAGMIVYDTSRKMLAVYNGLAWTFWQAHQFANRKQKVN